MSETIIKPCPFCGCWAIEYNNDDLCEWLQCTNIECGAKIERMWNTLGPTPAARWRNRTPVTPGDADV